MDFTLKELLDSPQLHLYMDEIASVINKEEKARKAFYNKISENDKAEFINGEEVFHSPVKLRHSNASDMLLILVSSYCKINSLGLVAHEKLMVEFTRNSYEPDIVFFKKEKSKKFKDDQMFFPVPDFIVEVLSPSTEKNDRSVKFEDYEAHGVAEYWIIDPDKEVVEQYVLENKKYDLNLKSKTGDISSKVIHGFKIPIKAIFKEKENLAALNQILNQNKGKRKF